METCGFRVVFIDFCAFRNRTIVINNNHHILGRTMCGRATSSADGLCVVIIATVVGPRVLNILSFVIIDVVIRATANQWRPSSFTRTCCVLDSECEKNAKRKSYELAIGDMYLHFYFYFFYWRPRKIAIRKIHSHHVILIIIRNALCASLTRNGTRGKHVP